MADDIPAAAGNGNMLIKPSTWESLRKRVEDLEVIPDPKDFETSTRGGKKHLRLRRVPGAVRPGPPPIPALTLSAGKDGARIYKGVLEWAVTTLEFEKLRIKDAAGGLLEEVNSFTGQKAIPGVEVMKRDGEEEEEEDDEDDGWWDLDWWGQVWAKVTLDPESGAPTGWDIVGPAKPSMREIPAMGNDLTRDSSGSGSGGGEIGYAILIGDVPEDGPIEQERTGNLEWFCAIVPENSSGSSSGSQSSSSSSGSGSSGSGSSGSGSSGSGSSASGSGSSGPGSSGPGSSGQGSSGPGSSSGSSKDTAVVPTPSGYRKWYAMEATGVMFFDFLELEVSRGLTRHAIDPVVLFCMEKGSIRAFVSPERGAATARVVGDEVLVRARHFPWPRRQRIQVMLCGIRRGFHGVRMASATFQEFVDNECRLNPRLTREQILAEFAKQGVTE